MSQQPPWDYPGEYVHPHVQQHIPPQWQAQPGHRRQAVPPAWKPPVTRQFAAPQKTRPRRPPYPSHLVRFPGELLGMSSRRSRGPSFWRMVYLGTHPIALLMTVFLLMFAIELWLMWIGFVITLWLLWVAAVTAGWGCHVVLSAVTGSRRGRL